MAMPSLVRIAAIAAVCGVDRGWLAFGSATKAPSPRDAISDPELAKWHAAVVALMAQKEALKRIELDRRKWGRHWNARFDGHQKARRAIARIKDQALRDQKLKQWSKEFDQLAAELNPRLAEDIERYREAGLGSELADTKQVTDGAT